MKKAPRYRQDFIVNGRYLGAAMRYDVQVHEDKCPPSGKAYFCPYCAKVWALAPVTDSMTNYPTRCFSSDIPCEKHDDRFGCIPGAISSTWDEVFNSTLPDDVIAYDFQQALKLYKDDHE